MQTPAHKPAGLASGLRSLGESIFYGNYFYGICALSLQLETATQLRLNLDNPLIYLMSFLVTVLFYNYPYLKHLSPDSDNPRTQWFVRNHRFVLANQILFTLGLLACIVYLALKYSHAIAIFSPLSWVLMMIFPITGALYYGANRLSPRLNLRQIGWLKPFLIGFVWAGLANVYPILYANLIHAQPLEITLFRVVIFVKTLMYVSMVAIMFDIKDYEVDQQSRLRTWIVRFGLRRTLNHVIVPMTLLGLMYFISYALLNQFSALKMVLIMIPFFAVIASTKLFDKQRSLLFYLSVIDGLLIVKAFFGIIAVSF